MKKGWFEVTNVTSSVPSAATPRTHVKSTMSGKGDGYLTTAGKYLSPVSVHRHNILISLFSDGFRVSTCTPL
jgi:hypothetical protein